MRKLGHALVLGAMVGYAASTVTLDFYGEQTGPTELGLTYFDLLTGQGTASGLTVAGGILMTFGPPLLIVILDLMLLMDRRRGAALHGLVAAVATWATITIGSALNIFGFDAFPMGVGFWAQIVCVAIAVAGTLLLLNAPAGD
ncbi:MAG TPA: hypothetical protein VFI59_13680 [Actinomycetota bacterium]|nr:hypothetical protein [Actinomycetota bacterium]